MTSISVPRGRAFLLYGLPVLALLAAAVLPLASGERTLVLRDVLSTHLFLESAPAAALAEGRLAVLDPARGGGQPHTGNPNALPFYPTALLYTVAPLLWALNAHFWLHLLLAPAAGYLFARAWGLAPPAAWATGAAYAASGFFLSQMSFYNLVAGATLAPALVAAALFATRAGERERASRRRWAAAAGALWALLLLAGEPSVAAAALGLALFAVLVRGTTSGPATPSAPAPPAGPSARSRPRRPAALGPLVAGLAAGTLAALPQLVELARIYPASFRAARGALLAAGAGGGTGTAGSWHPLRAVEWLVPWAFGRFDLAGGDALWRAAFDTPSPPLFLSLAPGLLVLALVAVSGWRPAGRSARGAARLWAWAAVTLGLFVALGVHNPALAALLESPAAGAFRYPEKAWLAVALGGALLAGVGFERTLLARRLRPLAVVLGLLGLLLAVLAAVAFAAPATAVAWSLRPGATELPAGALLPPWTAILPLSLATLTLLGGALGLARRRPAAGGALLLAIHVATQLVLLRPLLASDVAPPYRPGASPLAAALPAGARVVHGGWGGARDVFPGTRAPAAPGTPVGLLTRRGAAELAPFAGAGEGLRYQLALAPEGLDSLGAQVARDLVRGAPDDRNRVRAVARLGAEYLLLPRPLDGVPAVDAELVGRFPAAAGRTVHLYRLPGAVPEARLATEVVPVAGPVEAFRVLAASGFARAATPVDWEPLAGNLEPSDPPPRPTAPDGSRQAGGADEEDGASAGGVTVLSSAPERLEVEVDAPRGGLVVAARSYLPVWRATVDGEPAAVAAADVYRLAVPVPPGRHRVAFEVDRRPLVLAAWSSLAGAASLLGLVGWGLAGRVGRRRSSSSPPEPPEPPV